MVRLSVASALVFGAPVVGVLFGALVAPGVSPWLVAPLPLAIGAACMTGWGVASALVALGRLVRGRPVVRPEESLADPANPGAPLDRSPGHGVMPWVGALAGLALGALLGLASGGLVAVLATGLLGALVGLLLRALARRALFTLDLT